MLCRGEGGDRVSAAPGGSLLESLPWDWEPTGARAWGMVTSSCIIASLGDSGQADGPVAGEECQPCEEAVRHIVVQDPMWPTAQERERESGSRLDTFAFQNLLSGVC